MNQPLHDLNRDSIRVFSHSRLKQAASGDTELRTLINVCVSSAWEYSEYFGQLLFSQGGISVNFQLYLRPSLDSKRIPKYGRKDGQILCGNFGGRVPVLLFPTQQERPCLWYLPSVFAKDFIHPQCIPPKSSLPFPSFSSYFSPSPSPSKPTTTYLPPYLFFSLLFSLLPSPSAVLLSSLNLPSSFYPLPVRIMQLSDLLR